MGGLSPERVRLFRQHVFGCRCALCKEVGEALGRIQAQECRIDSVCVIEIPKYNIVCFTRGSRRYTFIDPSESSMVRLRRVIQKLRGGEAAGWLVSYWYYHGAICGYRLARRDSIRRREMGVEEYGQMAEAYGELERDRERLQDWLDELREELMWFYVVYGPPPWKGKEQLAMPDWVGSSAVEVLFAEVRRKLDGQGVERLEE